MTYPNSYYSHTAIIGKKFEPLKADIDTEICIIGGGLAGLSCAHELLKRGKDVVLLETNEIGWGASGRNGGFVLKGYSLSQGAIDAKVGHNKGKQLFDASVEGVEMVRENIKKYDMQGVDATTGILSVIRYDDEAAMVDKCQQMGEKFNYDLTYLDKNNLNDYVNTDKYYYGSSDNNGFHFHPLNYCLGLSAAIDAEGGKIFEQTEVIAMNLDGERKTVTTKAGIVRAKQVVMCGGGYSTKAHGVIESSILPIATYVAVTEPIGDVLKDSIKTDAAIIDDRMAADYYRVVEGNRILWGGRITAKTTEPEKLAELIKADMVDVYPALKDVKIDFAWTGLMAYARHKMPYIMQVQKGAWACTAFGGHGMNTTAIGGRIIAEAICDETNRIDLFKSYGLQWNGGVFGPMAAQSIYNGMKVMDWWQESRSK